MTEDFIDIVANQKNVIEVSHYTSASSKIISSTFSLLEGDLFWETASSPTEQYIQVDFRDGIVFEDLQYDFTSISSPLIRCFYSYDMNVWNEFPFVQFYNSESSPDKDVLQKYEGEIIKVISMTDRTYVRYDPLTKTAMLFDSISDYMIVKTYLDDFFNNAPTIDVKYVYRYVDIEGNSKSLLDGLVCRGIKLQLNNISSDVVMNQFSVYSSINLDLTFTNLKYFNDNFFKPKYFESNPFIPSVAYSFFEMLSNSESL